MSHEELDKLIQELNQPRRWDPFDRMTRITLERDQLYVMRSRHLRDRMLFTMAWRFLLWVGCVVWVTALDGVSTAALPAWVGIMGLAVWGVAGPMFRAQVYRNGWWAGRHDLRAQVDQARRSSGDVQAVLLQSQLDDSWAYRD